MLLESGTKEMKRIGIGDYGMEGRTAYGIQSKIWIPDDRTTDNYYTHMA